MSGKKTMNRMVILNSRPIGAPTPDDFRLEEMQRPIPGDGQVLLHILYLSLDPYMRGRMSDAPSYAPPVAIGEVMVGGTVARVENSLHPDYRPGDLVLGYSGWQDYALSDGTGSHQARPADAPPLAGPRGSRYARLYRLHGLARHRPAQSRGDGGRRCRKRCSRFGGGPDRQAQGVPRGRYCRRRREVPFCDR